MSKSTRKGKGSRKSSKGLNINTWYDDTTRALVERSLSKTGGVLTKKAAAEARERSSDLSTSSDKKGVKFSGGAFQASYFKSKFARRGQLLNAIMCDLKISFPNECVVPHDPSLGEIQEAHKPNKEVVGVASFGGGPGTDAAGLAWYQRDHCPDSQFQCILYDFEKSWKRYTSTLETAFVQVGRVSLQFFPCDVTRGVDDYANFKVEIQGVSLLLFFYVCHETSILSRKGKMAFYKDISIRADRGAVVIMADVKGHSAQDLSFAADAMKGERKVTPLLFSRPHNAEVLAFRFDD